MKRKFIYFIILLSLILFSSMKVKAYEDYQNFSYTIDEDNKTITFTKYRGSSEEVVIPAIVHIGDNDYHVIVNGDVFYNNTIIRSVVFENGIKAGDTLKRLFRGCTSLESVDFADFDTSNTTVMSQMFHSATAIKKIDFSGFNTSKVVNMAYMFYNASSLEDVNTLSFDTSNVENFSYMYRYCSSIKYLDLSNYTSEKGTDFHYMFDNCPLLETLDIRNLDTSHARMMNVNFGSDTPKKLRKVIVGKNFRIDNNFGNSFGRGTWIRKEDGQHVDAVDVPFLQDSSGTYEKLTDTVESFSTMTPVTYRINPDIARIDSFYTDNPEKFEMLNNQEIVIKDLTVATSDDYLVPGYVELVFKNAVSDANNNMHDLYLKIDNVHLYDINQDAGVASFYSKIFRIRKYGEKSGIYLYNYFYKTMDDLINGVNTIYKESSVFEDVTLKVLDSNGNSVDGNYLFSIYDLDGSSVRDINSSYLSPAGTAGYGEFSEGTKFIEGFDSSTLWMHDHTFLIQPSENRITGTRPDNVSELSEYVIVASAKGAKFTWNGSGNVGSSILYHYQPRIISFEYINLKNSLLSGAKLSLYNSEGNLVKEWTSDKIPTNILLNPGKYILKQTNQLNGYEQGEDIEFYVDFDENATEELDKIVMRVDYHLDENPKTGNLLRLILLINIVIIVSISLLIKKQKNV